jgi:hypothetical protein
MEISIKKILIGVAAFIALIIIVAINPFSTNETGFRQHVRTFGGNEYVRFEPGFYFSGFFSEVTTWPDVITVQYDEEEDEADDVTFFATPHGVRFNGGDNARLGHTVKWSLPDDEENMLSIQRDYRNHLKLASTTLSQYQKETAGYATQMMDSETHYSGGQSTLKENFQDQLRFGQILLNKKTDIVRDSITNETRNIIIVEPRYDAEGNVMRTPSDIQKYNITPSFVSIDYVKYDELIEGKLKAKIESATRKSVSEQLLITAQQEALTAIEDGKKQIEQVRATEEAAKIKAVIQAEKATAVALESLKKAEADAKAELTRKKAQAEGDRLKVLAGLTPLERAKIDKETAIGVAEQLAKVQFPELMIIGGNGSQGQTLDPFQAVGLESLINISKKMSTSKK